MPSATFSALKPDFLVRGPMHMNSKRPSTEDVSAGDVGKK